MYPSGSASLDRGHGTVDIREDPMSTATGTLTAEDLELLERPLHGFLTVAGTTRPVWFEATAAGTIQFFTLADSPKLRRLRRDPRASLVVAAPAGERERWVVVSGRTTEEPDGARDLSARLAARYWDLDDRADDLAAILAEDTVRIVLHPETVHRYAF